MGNIAVWRSSPARCSIGAIWGWPFCLAAFLGWFCAGLTVAAECYRTSCIQGTAAAGDATATAVVTAPGAASVTALACEDASCSEASLAYGQCTTADRSALGLTCTQAAPAGLGPCFTQPNQEERNFSPSAPARAPAAVSELQADAAPPLGCGTELVAWGPYHPWLYRPHWVYPYRYYPLRWSYSIYSPYYFYSPYNRWPTTPAFGYRSYLAYGWGQPWYAPWGYSGAIAPYYGSWSGFGVDGCCDWLCDDWACYGCGAVLPYDSGPYLGWPYDAGRSFAAPWGGLFGTCCVPRFAPCCPPGCIDVSGALHW